MSEPTESEQRERQEQLDRESSEFLSAVGLGIFDPDGLELYSDQTYRPALMRPPPPPVPSAGTEHFVMATGDSTPQSHPDLVESSPDLTPKRQRTTDAASSTSAILAQAAAALESAPSREPRRKVEKTLGKVSPRTRSPRTASPRSVTAPPVPKLVPKAPPAHLRLERLAAIAAAAAAAEAAETATFGTHVDTQR